jgi:hypothetical protein
MNEGVKFTPVRRYVGAVHIVTGANPPQLTCARRSFYGWPGATPRLEPGTFWASFGLLPFLSLD